MRNPSCTIPCLVFIDMDKGQTARGRWDAAVKERKLNYRFHNPNPTAATADYLLKIFMEANREKVQLAIQAVANGPDGVGKKDDEGHPA